MYSTKDAQESMYSSYIQKQQDLYLNNKTNKRII